MGTLKASPPDAAFVAELAQASGVRECLQWVVRERQWINEQHLQLCRIPAPTFLEGKRAEWMVNQFRAYGYDARIDRAGNVVAQADPAHRGALVAVTAHLDTVLAPRTPEDIKVHPDGALAGPGVSDNGAGLAALLALARALKAAPRVESANSVTFVANVGEEGEGNLSGMRYLCRQSSLASRIRSFLVLDGPTTDHITCQALASRRFEIAFVGSGGHSWSDFGIGNPVHALSRGIAFFVDDPVARATTPRTSFNFGTIEGGSSINSIPTEARTKVDIRSESPARIDELVELLTSCIDRSLQTENDRATGGRLSARFKEVGSRPGGRLADNASILRYIRAVDAHLGVRSHLDCASTDANIPLSMGLPAISIGAGGQGGGAHTPNEWFHPDGREGGLKRVLLALFCLLMEP
ncbi:MAG TPA: M20/M25/M40 family metallo-hydrolase [Bryobacteraceae bacterium]|nr:M20/M25/M40 family metallo-hydrolase [Bryobacteraceae bacterium]